MSVGVGVGGPLAAVASSADPGGEKFGGAGTAAGERAVHIDPAVEVQTIVAVKNLLCRRNRKRGADSEREVGFHLYAVRCAAGRVWCGGNSKRRIIKAEANGVVDRIPYSRCAAK